jgi:hypothetical protein
VSTIAGNWRRLRRRGMTAQHACTRKTHWNFDPGAQ